MTGKLRRLGVLVIVGLIMVNNTSLSWSQTRSTGWHNDLDTAARLSAKTGKPMMVVFRCER